MSTLPPLSNNPVSDDRYNMAVDFLISRINYEKSASIPYGKRYMKLDRMRQLLNRLGNPDAGVPIVHIAGTKGKGSTSAIVANILQSSGYSTGLFSSPHLEHVEERFKIDGIPCPPEEFVVLIERLKPVVESMDHEAMEFSDASLSPTYFELTTALAFMHFAVHRVDVIVLEVGMGGRLDSTNVCQPIATVIASISLDHTKQLGNTIAEIAAEKAGIIKPGVPVFCGLLQQEAEKVIRQISMQHGSRMYVLGRDMDFHYTPPINLGVEESHGKIDVCGKISGNFFNYEGLEIQMLGEHQAANAAVAIAVSQELRHQGKSISDQSIKLGLAQARIPARIEVIHRSPTVVLDVAHNQASAEVLVAALKKSFSANKRVLILAVSRDKDVKAIVDVLIPHFNQVVITEYQDNPRAVKVAQLKQSIINHLEKNKRIGSVEIFEAVFPYDAWSLAKKTASDDSLICVAGSFFIVAELRQKLLAESW